jgi:hypothetical protein
MKPTNHAARLRQMAETAAETATRNRSAAKKSFDSGFHRLAAMEVMISTHADDVSAALLAGAEALGAIERAEKCLDGISVTAVQCFDRAAEVADLAEGVLDAMEGEKEKSDG